MSNAFKLVYDNFYGQRSDVKRSTVESWLRNSLDRIHNSLNTRATHLNRFVAQVNEYADAMQLSDDTPNELRLLAQSSGVNEVYLVAVFAVVREIAHRQLGMRHFDVQLIGGWAMMQGLVAEMETGQGKTLTATLAGSAAALAGFPTHVITVNEYLASRDANWMRPVYEALGLSVGVVRESMAPGEKQAAYACDVTYCTNKQIAFDYLRDRIEVGMHMSERQLQLESLYNDQPTGDALLLKGLYFAIVDEADSILIDEAVTPLIISTAINNDSKRVAYQRAIAYAEQLTDDEFEIHEEFNAIEFTRAGRHKLEALGKEAGGIWRSPVLREELISQALRALHLFKRDRQYLVADNKVQIVDEFTGRLMPDRSWEGGLHQMIELKEGCEMTGDKETLARISYQRFFRRYLNLAGMTGTGSEVRTEIRKVYGLDVFRIPPAQTIQRVITSDYVSLSAEEKWQAIVARIRQLHDSGRPILIGTRSVEASEHLSGLLDAHKITHSLLNARQDEHEAEIIAKAGKKGMVTVATNMAGRGTDIKLDDEIRSLGGLHVIMTERHDSRRIDRQLFGRCARQGDPGSVETFVSLEDDLVQINTPVFLRSLIVSLCRFDNFSTKFLARVLFFLAQRSVERRHYVARCNVLKTDDQYGDMLAFSGRME